MKHIKLYKNKLKNHLPQVNDYAITKVEHHIELSQFLSNNIGQIIHIGDSTPDKTIYRINYNNIPTNLTHHFLHSHSGWYGYFYLEDIIHYNKNPEKLQLYIDTNKYNL